MGSKRICREFRLCPSEAVLNLSPKAHTKTDTSSQEKLFGEIQKRNSKQLLSMGRMFFIKCKLPMWIKILTFAHTFTYYNRNKKAV